MNTYRKNSVLNQHRQKLLARKLKSILYIYIYPMSNASIGFWQVLLGTQAHVCMAVALPLADLCSTSCQKWGLFQYVFDILLQDSFFKPTLIVLKSFATVLAGAPDSLCTAAPKDSMNNNDQLLLEEVFLDQLCWCSSISGSMKQVSAAGRGYFWDDLQWLQNFKDDKGRFVGFSEVILIIRLWILNSSSKGFSMLRHRWHTALVVLVNLTGPKIPCCQPCFQTSLFLNRLECKSPVTFQRAVALLTALMEAVVEVA